MSKSANKPSKARRWSARVAKHSNALDLRPKVFRSSNPRQVALSLKRSAERSKRRRRLLLSAERFSDKATWRGLLDRKTFGRRSSALLCLATRADQRLAFDGLFADLLIGTSNQKEEQGSPLFLTLRKPIPHRRDQWSTLPKLISRAAEYLRVPFLPRRAGPWPGAGCRGAVAAVVGRDS